MKIEVDEFLLARILDVCSRYIDTSCKDSVEKYRNKSIDGIIDDGPFVSSSEDVIKSTIEWHEKLKRDVSGLCDEFNKKIDEESLRLWKNGVEIVCLGEDSSGKVVKEAFLMEPKQ